MNRQKISQTGELERSGLKKENLLIKKTARAPFTLSENGKGYNLFLILSGIERKDIFVDIDTKENELSVFVAKKDKLRHEAAFWVFAVPRDALLNKLTTRSGRSGLEITIPKAASLFAA